MMTRETAATFVHFMDRQFSSYRMGTPRRRRARRTVAGEPLTPSDRSCPPLERLLSLVIVNRWTLSFSGSPRPQMMRRLRERLEADTSSAFVHAFRCFDRKRRQLSTLIPIMLTAIYLRSSLKCSYPISQQRQVHRLAVSRGHGLL